MKFAASVEPPQGWFPSLQIPHFDFSQLRIMLVNAAVLGMLGCIDALLASVVADSITRTEHHLNKELINQGLGNLVSSLFSGVAAGGSHHGDGGEHPGGGAFRSVGNLPCSDPESCHPGRHRPQGELRHR